MDLSRKRFTWSYYERLPSWKSNSWKITTWCWCDVVVCLPTYVPFMYPPLFSYKATKEYLCTLVLSERSSLPIRHRSRTRNQISVTFKQNKCDCFHTHANALKKFTRLAIKLRLMIIILPVFFLVNLFAIMEKIINLVFFLLLLTFRTCHVTMIRFYHVFSISLHFSTENPTKVTFSQNYHHANMSYKMYYIARQHSILYFLVFLAL